MIDRPRLTQHERARLGFRRLLVVTLLAVRAVTVLALDPETLPSQYLYTAWQDELPQNTVQAILQTTDGYLWIGTQGGLVRFDGVRFVEIRIEGDEATPADVRSLLQDPDGVLWVGTRGSGLLRYEDGALRPAVEGASPADAAEAGPASGPPVVFALARSADGTLWLGTRNHGVMRFKDGRFESLGPQEEFPAERILSLAVDKSGGVWAGASEGGLAKLEGSTLRPFGREQLSGDGVLSLLEDHRGDLWIGTRRSGLLHLGGDLSGPPLRVDGVDPDAIMAMTEDRQGNLWLATYGRGLVRLPENRRPARRSDTDAGLASNAVMSVFEDREGNLWAGTEGGGLNRLREGAFRTFGTAEGLLEEQVWTVLEDREGTIWIGTEGGGLGRLEDGRITNLTTRDGLSSDSVTSLLEARDGSLWVGSRGKGLNRLRGGEITIFDRRQGLTNDTVFAMAQDAQGTLWLGTPASGLNRLQGGRFERVEVSGPANDDLADDLILGLANLPDGRLVLATDSGLKFLGPTGVTTLTTADGLSNDTLFSLYVDAAGTVWAGTYGAGLNRVEDGRVFAFDRSLGLHSDAILQILEDDQGYLWMGSNQGIFRIAKSELDEVARGRRAAVTSSVFGKADGMRAAECNGGYQPSGWKDHAGRLWFPTIRGVVMVDPARLRSNPVPPGLSIESVLVDGTATDLGRKAVFEPGRKRFEFTYTALSFSAPEQVRFRYRLEGYDNDWIEAGGQRQATYTNLPADREYRFRVVAANDAGVWNEEGSSFSFAIEPFFYQRPTFLLAASLGLALLFWSVYKLRLRQLLRRTQQLEALVTERTQEVVEQRDQLRTANDELTRLNDFKSEFLGIAAHDLKNPLSIIYGYAGSIADMAGDSPRMVRVARRISTSANQMLNIVSDLLDTTAMERGKLRFDAERLDLSGLVEDVVDRFQVAAAERDIQLVAANSESLEVVGDREKLIRVCENLVSNAIR
ncbi:MAG: hypothetical protein KDD47_11625, partial [Acidobacteria bacterium]|nr:hypothetical protein [Acidobacteriota bacterium]